MQSVAAILVSGVLLWLCLCPLALGARDAEAPGEASKIALPGVREMTDRSNSTDPIPCTCGVFLSSQCRPASGGQPQGRPALSHEFNRPTAKSAYGNKQCSSACVDMIVKHLSNSAAIICASIGRDCSREKAFLYIKNNDIRWIPTRLSAGREFCCKDGRPVKCR